MKIILRLFFISSFYFLILVGNTQSQEVQRHQAVTAYIYNFAKNILWQNEDSIKEFQFIVISEDKNIIQEMMNLSKAKTLRNKSIKVTSTSSIGDVSKVQLIYLAKEKENYFVELFDKIEGKKIC